LGGLSRREHLVAEPDIYNGIRCIVCGNRDAGRFTIKYRKPNCAIVRCADCSFCFIPPHYRKSIDYTQYKTPATVQEVARGDLWLKIQRNLLRYRLIRKYHKSGKVFDIGCGFGHFLLTGKQLGYDVSGVETSKANVEFIRNRFQIQVEESDFLKVRENASFDIMTLWDVLEHIDNADRIIEKTSRMLKPGGTVFVQVPQLGSFFSVLMGSNWWAMGLDHVNYFSRKTIRDLFARNGMDVKQIRSSIELKNVLIYVILPRLKRRRKTVSSWSTADRQKEFNRLTRKPMWMRRVLVGLHNGIYRALSFFHIGDEMIVVAQKRS
jgi:2-polyprenyl-3-methyl-5-hydroxy-6-metoxy-1,4-benzoquinol methylase